MYTTAALADNTPETPVQQGDKETRSCISVEIDSTAAGHQCGYVCIPRGTSQENRITEISSYSVLFH